MISLFRLTVLVLSLTGKAPEVFAQFANEDIGKWTIWKRSDKFFARGRAYSIAKTGDKAEADLSAALPWISAARAHDGILLAPAKNRECTSTRTLFL